MAESHHIEVDRSDRDIPVEGAFNDPKYRTYRIEGRGLEPRFQDREYVTTNSSIEPQHGYEIVIRRKTGRPSIALCSDDLIASLLASPEVLETSVVVGRSVKPFAIGEIVPFPAPMPMSSQVASANGELVDLVEPHDRRLAVRGPRVDLDAWFEDRMNEDPVSIVITALATDARLASLARRFEVEPTALFAFRDALPA